MALESRITQEEIKKEPEKPIDREKVEFLLQSLFCSFPLLVLAEQFSPEAG